MKETKTKEQYTPPKSEGLEVRLEGVIAQSDPNPGDYNNPFTDGGSWHN